MLEFIAKSDSDAMNILKKDHEKVKGLFSQFERADNAREKKKIASEVINELKIHTTIEEGIFYPALRKQNIEAKIFNEADEEHHVAKLLIAELERMDGSEDHYDAKFKVLEENIRHHIKEEEHKMFLQARATDMDFIALGEKLLDRKEQLMEKGVPVFAEEKMMVKNKVEADSPAEAARKANDSGGRDHDYDHKPASKKTHGTHG